MIPILIFVITMFYETKEKGTGI